MQNSFINKINVCAKIIILNLLILMIILSKSIYLIGLLTILSLIIFILLDENIKEYTLIFKSTIIYLLFIIIAYIIISRDIFNILIFIYKLFLIEFYLIEFILSVNYYNFVNGVYTMILKLSYFSLYAKQISNNIGMVYVCFKSFFEANKKIKIKKINIFKYYLIPVIQYTNTRIKATYYNLEIKYYKLTKEKFNKMSFVLICIFFILFLVVLFKEVIL